MKLVLGYMAEVLFQRILNIRLLCMPSPLVLCMFVLIAWLSFDLPYFSAQLLNTVEGRERISNAIHLVNTASLLIWMGLRLRSKLA